MEFLRTRRTYRRFDQRPIAPEIPDRGHWCQRPARRSCGANRRDCAVYPCAERLSAVSARAAAGPLGRLPAAEQGVPKPEEQPTAFIAVLQDTRLPGCSDVDVGLRRWAALTAAARVHGVGRLHRMGSNT